VCSHPLAFIPPFPIPIPPFPPILLPLQADRPRGRVLPSGLSEQHYAPLARLEWVRKHPSVMVLGPTVPMLMSLHEVPLRSPGPSDPPLPRAQWGWCGMARLRPVFCYPLLFSLLLCPSLDTAEFTSDGIITLSLFIVHLVWLLSTPLRNSRHRCLGRIFRRVAQAHRVLPAGSLLLCSGLAPLGAEAP